MPQVIGGRSFDHIFGNFGFGLLPWDKATFSPDMHQGCPHEDCILPWWSDHETTGLQEADLSVSILTPPLHDRNYPTDEWWFMDHGLNWLIERPLWRFRDWCLIKDGKRYWTAARESIPDPDWVSSWAPLNQQGERWLCSFYQPGQKPQIPIQFYREPTDVPKPLNW